MSCNPPQSATTGESMMFWSVGIFNESTPYAACFLDVEVLNTSADTATPLSDGNWFCEWHAFSCPDGQLQRYFVFLYFFMLGYNSELLLWVLYRSPLYIERSVIFLDVRCAMSWVQINGDLKGCSWEGLQRLPIAYLLARNVFLTFAHPHRPRASNNKRFPINHYAYDIISCSLLSGACRPLIFVDTVTGFPRRCSCFT